MAIELSNGRFSGLVGNPLLSSTDIKTIQNASEWNQVGTIFTRAWDAIADWFCDTHRVEAKKCLFNLYSDSTNEHQKVSSFVRLTELVGDAYQSRFQIEENEDHVTYKLVLGLDGVKDFALTCSNTQGDSAITLNDAIIQSACGFRNLGNTCYANSALKFLLNSMGQDYLVNHLESFKNATEDSAKRDAAAKFLEVTKAAFDKTKPLEQELKGFFSSLQGLEGFNQKDRSGEYYFKIIGVQNDAQEFLLKVADIFNLSTANGYSVAQQELLVKGNEQRPARNTLALSHDITVSDPRATLQDIMNLTCVSEKVEVRWKEGDAQNSQVTKTKQWAVPDISSFKRFNLHINTLNYDIHTGTLRKTVLENASFTDDVVLNILDTKTKKVWKVTLEPQDIVIQSGNASGGHYFMYTKQAKGGWIKHDDSTVRACDGLGARDQAKMISFAVKKSEPLEQQRQPLA